MPSWPHVLNNFETSEGSYDVGHYRILSQIYVFLCSIVNVYITIRHRKMCVCAVYVEFCNCKLADTEIIRYWYAQFCNSHWLTRSVTSSRHNFVALMQVYIFFGLYGSLFCSVDFLVFRLRYACTGRSTFGQCSNLWTANRHAWLCMNFTIC